MSRIADFFVAICIVAVSTSIGIVMFYQLELPPITAVAVVMLLAFMLMLVNLRNVRLQDRSIATEKIDFLAKRFDQVTSDLDNLERRLTALETTAARRSRQELEPVVAEVEVIGALIRQVVETVADLESQIGAPQKRPSAAEVMRNEQAATEALAAGAATGPTGDLVPKRFEQLGEAGFLKLVRAAIDANRIDIHLQPIVTLPQRKIRYYEALTRLRTEEGETLYPADYLPIAEKAGIMPAIDNQIVLRVMQILRRLTQRTKEVGVFCNISPTSLGDGEFFGEFLQFLDANKSMADELLFEFPQRSLKTLGAIEYEGLRAMQGLGYKFSVDKVEDLRSSFQFLADRGFRFAKISAERLLSGSEALATDIHPADLSHYFSRFGMELIADHIEVESQVVDVLDFAIKFGQGFLFAPPRPVKADMSAANSDEKSASAEASGEIAPAAVAPASGEAERAAQRPPAPSRGSPLASDPSRQITTGQPRPASSAARPSGTPAISNPSAAASAPAALPPAASDGSSRAIPPVRPPERKTLNR